VTNCFSYRFDKTKNAVESVSQQRFVVPFLSDENVDVVFTLAVALKSKIAIGVANGLIGLESVPDFCLER